jgi:transcription termination factor Rho
VSRDQIKKFGLKNGDTVLTYIYFCNRNERYLIISDIININFNFFSNNTVNNLYVSKKSLSNQLNFTSDIINSNNTDTTSNFIETTNYQRFLRFNNPLISYDFKCGNYLGI